MIFDFGEGALEVDEMLNVGGVLEVVIERPRF